MLFLSAVDRHRAGGRAFVVVLLRPELLPLIERVAGPPAELGYADAVGKPQLSGSANHLPALIQWTARKRSGRGDPGSGSTPVLRRPSFDDQDGYLSSPIITLWRKRPRSACSQLSDGHALLEPDDCRCADRRDRPGATEKSILAYLPRDQAGADLSAGFVSAMWCSPLATPTA